MWVFTKYGFFSFVKHERGYAVRSRSRAHLEALKKRLGLDCSIDTKSGTDYPCRIYVDKETWTRAITTLAGEVDYDNFKKAVGTKDAPYARALSSVWAIMAGRRFA